MEFEVKVKAKVVVGDDDLLTIANIVRKNNNMSTEADVHPIDIINTGATMGLVEIKCPDDPFGTFAVSCDEPELSADEINSPG